MHGCHVAALKTQLHAALQPAGALAAALPTAGEHSAVAAAEGHRRTIAELRAVVEGKTREACAAAAHIRTLEQDRAQAERWASMSCIGTICIMCCLVGPM